MYKSFSITVALAFVLALASGQAQSINSTPSVPSATVPSPAAAPTVDPREQCVQNKKCGNDVNCIATCFNVPGPNDTQVQDTINCVRQCSTADNNQWAQCRDKCINDHYQAQAQTQTQLNQTSSIKASTTTVATTSTLGVKPSDAKSNNPSSTTKGSPVTATAVPNSGIQSLNATKDYVPWALLAILFSPLMLSA